MDFSHLLYHHALAMEHASIYYQKEENFKLISDATVAMLQCLQQGGKLVFVGCGKSFKLVCKTVATLTSLGIRARELHPIEALHGDIGICDESDLVVFCSTSGETDEVVNLLRYMSGSASPWASCVRIAVTGNTDSTLATSCHHVVPVPQPSRFKEQALQAGLRAPTVSTTLMLTILDCICVHLSHLWFDNDSASREVYFNKRHPGGGIGKITSKTNLSALFSGSSHPSKPQYLSYSVEDPSSLTHAQFLSLLIGYDYLSFPFCSELIPTSLLRAEHRLAITNNSIDSWFARYLNSDHTNGHSL